MAVFAIRNTSSGLNAFVGEKNVGSNVNALEFNVSDVSAGTSALLKDFGKGYDESVTRDTKVSVSAAPRNGFNI